MKNKKIKFLWIVMFINLSFFFIEFVSGKVYHSVALLEDSFDMLADSFMYAISLVISSKCICRKRLFAKSVAVMQTCLVFYGVFEIFKRFLGYSNIPDYKMMMIVSFFALLGNAISVLLLQKINSDEVHIKATIICSSNDVKVNFLVIVSALFVYLTGSFIPDLIVGILILYFVLKGVKEIFEESNKLSNTVCPIHKK